MRSIPITDPGNGATTTKPTVNPPVRSTPRGSCSEAGAITAANGWANLVPSPGGLNRPPTGRDHGQRGRKLWLEFELGAQPHKRFYENLSLVHDDRQRQLERACV